MNCPKCGLRLVSPQEVLVDPDNLFVNVIPEAPPQGTFLGRVLIGSICSLGLLLSFRELTIAILGPEQLVVSTLCIIRFLAVAAGSMLTGAGRANGSQPGLMVGLFVGSLLTINDVINSGGPEFWWPIGIAVGYPVVAGIGGWIGSRIWPEPVQLPNVSVPSAVSASRASLITRLGSSDEERPSQRPTLWLRIFVCALIAFASIIATDQIRLFLAKASIGMFNTGGHFRAAAVGAQLAAILLVVAGMISGASTGAGIRHGLLTSILTIVNLWVSVVIRGFPIDPPVAGLLAYLNIPETEVMAPQSIAIIIGTIVTLVTSGGWLGSQLFPPLAPEWMRQRHLPTQV